MITPTPLEQLLGIASAKRKVSIGVPAPEKGDKRFPLTPEGAGMLIERGFDVKIEQGGAKCIHYDDYRYQEHDVDITDRSSVLRCDIVLSLSALSSIDCRQMKRGAMLLTLAESALSDAETAMILVRNRIITLALDLVADERGNKPFYDILAEISGRASMAVAASQLCDPERGKGMLLGGVAGIVPCEVTIIGSGIDAVAAARSALGLGAMVRMFDNDVYRLRCAVKELGHGVMASALHPHVLVNALRSADVVVATPIKLHHVISADVVAEMKQGVITFDLDGRLHPVFPSMPRTDCGVAEGLTAADGKRICYVNPANAVPRTVAMALSNTLVTMLSDVFNCDGVSNALMLNDGLQRSALTFMGRPVHPSMGALLGVRAVDIKIMLQFG